MPDDILNPEINPINCNLMLVGQSGSGKSSLANYLFGKEMFTTGIGGPVTDWKDNFQSSRLNLPDVTLNIYDTVGYDNSNIDRWLKTVPAFLSSMTEASTDEFAKLNDRMHLSVYVVNGAGEELELSELSLIDKIRLENNLSAAVVITNSDISEEYQLKQIEDLLQENNYNSVRVCSVDTVTADGPVMPFGKEAALDLITGNFLDSAGNRLVVSAYDFLADLVSEINQKLIDSIEKSKISIFKYLNNIEKFNSDFDQIIKPVNETYDFANPQSLMPLPLKAYMRFFKMLDPDNPFSSEIDRRFGTLSGQSGKVVTGNEDCFKAFKDKLENPDNKALFSKLRILANLGSDIRCKRFLKKSFTALFEDLERRLRRLVDDLR